MCRENRWKASESNVKVHGRTLYRQGIRYLGYSGSGITFRFRGKKAGAVLCSNVEDHDENGRAWVAVFVNEEVTPTKRFPLETTKKEYVIYESLQEEEVTITLMKYSEAEYAVCGIQEIFTDAEELLPPPEAKKRKIEIIGDSITCGYGVEGQVTDEIFTTATENPMKSYSMQMARGLDADENIVAWNGKGVITSYVGEEGDIPDTSWLVPMLYDYTDAGCERDYFHNPKETWEKWDHSRFQADVVTVYLGTNDASYTREFPERKEKFCTAYVKFLEKIRKAQPKASIFCMLGNMDQRLCSTVEEAVNRYRKDHEETNVYYLALPLQKEEDGLGTFWHPTYVTQKKTADLAVKFIKETMGWQ